MDPSMAGINGGDYSSFAGEDDSCGGRPAAKGDRGDFCGFVWYGRSKRKKRKAYTKVLTRM
jgi:hypothetical protein